jgi:hypothetical protein
MKPTPPPILSQHRLARFATWGRLWLQGFAAALLFLVQVDPVRVRRELALTARFVGTLVFLRLVQGFRPPRRKSWRKPVRRPGMLRTIKGSRLRRRLRARDPVARFFAILAVMRDLDQEVARLKKRLARGLTRLRSIPPAHEHDALALAASEIARACAADTS